jgi:hypothetical protein
LPGEYTARLTVDGHTYSEPLTVTAPVMVSAPQAVQFNTANKQAQVALLGRIQAEQSDVTAAEREAGTLRKQLAALGTQATGPLASAIKSLDKKAEDVQGFAGAPAPDSSGEGAATPAYNSLMGLDATLRELGMALQQAGMSPPQQAVLAGFDATQRTTAATLGAWQQLKTRDVEQLNAQLRNANLPAIHS